MEASAAAKVPAVAVVKSLPDPTGDSPTDDGDNDDERGNNSDYLVLGHVLTSQVALQLRPSIGKGNGRREAGPPCRSCRSRL